jgi:hypothetical protein
MKRTVLPLVIAVLATSVPRAARADEQWTGGDWLYGGLSAAGGGTLGAAGGALAGSLLDPPCQPDDTSCLPAFTLAGAGAGLIIGSAYGVSTYGRKRGLDGSFRKAVLGALLGNIASGSAMVIATRVIDEPSIGIPVAIGVLVGFPATGATIMYKRSVHSEGPSSGPPPPPPLPVALVEHDPATGTRIGVPAITFAAVGDDVAVHVSLASGRF